MVNGYGLLVMLFGFSGLKEIAQVHGTINKIQVDSNRIVSLVQRQGIALQCIKDELNELL
jgi:hypothetical protein